MLALRGELDLVGAPALEAQLHKLENAEVDHLVLDLSDLSFMDSSGLQVVLAADLRARETARRLEIWCGEGQVKRLFALTGVDCQLQLSDARPVTPARGDQVELT